MFMDTLIKDIKYLSFGAPTKPLKKAVGKKLLGKKREVPIWALSDICNICYEPLQRNDSIKTPCNHTFHKDCICSWLKRKNTCPSCRATIPQNNWCPNLPKKNWTLEDLENPQRRRELGIPPARAITWGSDF